LTAFLGVEEDHNDDSGCLAGHTVKAWQLLGQTRAPDGADIALTFRGGEYVILAGGRSLMSSRMHGSEEALATLACRRALTLERPCVLVGGLGMGFTLRATLDLLPPDASVVVAELVPAVVEWNRGPLALLAGNPLRDPRVAVEIDDVAATLRASPGRFDAVLLDVDNGPAAFSASHNAGLYDDRGLAAARAALKPGGVFAIWSAWDDRKFEQRLRYCGFTVEVERVRGRLKRGGPHHTIFLGVNGAAEAAPARAGETARTHRRKRRKERGRR
jgi:spermidine synthase